MEEQIESVKEHFKEVTEKFDQLSVIDLAGLSKAFEEFEHALYEFDTELDIFLEEIKEEK